MRRPAAGSALTMLPMWWFHLMKVLAVGLGGAGVAVGHLLDPWPVFEVPVAQAADFTIDDIETVGERVVVGDVEEAARRDQGGHRAGPGVDVRDPL